MTSTLSIRRRLVRAALAAAALAICATPGMVQAQDYPSRPIRVVLPFPPGGITDLMTRALTEKLSPRLGQPIIVENRPGAGTMLASELVARAPADGYTLLMAASSIGTAPLLYQKVNYDAIKSFAPVTQVASVVHIVAVNPSLPVKNVGELLAHARKNPGKLNYGSTGMGTSTHLEMELLKSMGNAYLVHIPYKGSGPALIDMVAGQLDVMIDAWGSSGPFVKAGKLRALAVTTAKRSAALPDLPTVAESGLQGYEAMPWLGLMAPTGTPAPIVQRIQQEVAAILKEPEIQEKFMGWGLDIIGNTPAEFASFLRKDIVQWDKVIKSANIKAE